MDYAFQEGKTDVTINVVWVTKATGAYASVAHDAAGISVAFVRAGFDDVAISLAALADPDLADDAHADGQMGVVYAGGGIHRLDLPDTVCASGMAAGNKIVTISGETDAEEMLPVTIQLTAGVPGDTIPSAAANAAAIWDRATEDSDNAGSFGKAVIDILEDTATTLPAAVADLPTNAELATALGTADDAVLAAISTLSGKVDTIDDILDSEFPALVTAVADLPTNAELATALGTADDAVLAALIAAGITAAGGITKIAGVVLAEGGTGGQEIGEAP